MVERSAHNERSWVNPHYPQIIEIRKHMEISLLVQYFYLQHIMFST